MPSASVDPTHHVRVALDDGLIVTVAQAVAYHRLRAEHKVGEWHYCKNGCCMCVHKPERENSGWIIAQDGEVLHVDEGECVGD